MLMTGCRAESFSTGFTQVPSGIQVFGDYGTLQIDSDFINLALARKGTLTTTRFTNGESSSVNPSRASLPLYPGEIVAFACSSAPAAVIGRDGNTAYVGVKGPEGTTVSYWVFSPGTTESNFGIQVFNNEGKVAFDSAWRLFNVQTVISGTVDPGGLFNPSHPVDTFQLPPGKTYASVHLNTQARVTFVEQYQGAQPALFISHVRTTFLSCTKITGSTITITNSDVDMFVQVRRMNPGGGSGNTAVSGENNNLVTPSFLVIDVTGY